MTCSARKMRKLGLLSVSSAAAIAVALAIVFSMRGASTPEAAPEVLGVAPSQVTVAWTSESSYAGRVFYRPGASDEAPSSATEDFGPADKHEVVIKGLRASTRYTYWLDGSKARYQFQTQPLPATPFSFLVVWGDVSGRMMSLMMSEMPEFILRLNPLRKVPDPFGEIRPYLPVYGPRGIDSPFLRSAGGEGGEGGRDAPWKLDWGGLRLVFCEGTAELLKLLDAPAAHTLGVVVLPDSRVRLDAGEEETIRSSAMHPVLVSHNERSPSRPAAFVLLPGAEGRDLNVDGVRYLGLRTDREGGAMRIDVAVESTRAVLLDEGREIVLRKPPLKEKRTCEECRRLADQGAYEESVKAYEEFVESHKGHFQIDDAYFAAGEILDERLFRFPRALEWYRRLLHEYPNSSLAPLARQRVEFLTAHADHGFEPLARFERVRRVEFARKKHSAREREKCLEEVRAILKEYPKCSVAPVMCYWLANQYRRIDPDRAAAAYETLADEFPAHPYAREVWLEIGETYYDAGRHREAIAAYERALVELPGRTDDINAQIARARRNLRRNHLAAVSWGVLLITCALGVSWPPRGIQARLFIPSAVAFVPLSAAILFAGWLIHEEFSSAGELILLTLGFCASACLGLPFSRTLAEKALRAEAGRPRRALSAVLGGALGLTLLAAGMYLTIYHVNEHYLIVIGL